MLGLFVFRPIVYKPLWETYEADLNDMKIWVFSQVSRFSPDPPILIFESLIQSGGSSSLILEPPPSGVNSSRSKNPQIDILHFPPFVLGFIPIFVLDEFHPKSETILHHLVIRARLFRFRIHFGLSFSSSSLFGFCRVVLVRWFGFLVVHFVLSSSFPIKLWWLFSSLFVWLLTQCF